MALLLISSFRRYSFKVSSDAYLETPAVLRLTGVPRCTLEYWVRHGLVSPSVRPGQGQRIPRRWSVADVVSIRCLLALRQAGCPTRLLVRVRQLLATEWGTALRGRHLLWDGRDVLGVWSRDDIESLVAQPGQGVLHLLALPLDEWHDEASARISQLSEGSRVGAARVSVSVNDTPDRAQEGA